MAATYEPIASTTLGSDAATVTIGSGGTIPGTYTDLMLMGHAYTKFTSVGNAALKVQVNGDTGGNYSYTALRGNGSSASSLRGSSTSFIEAAATYTTTSSTTTTFHPFILHFQSYADTNVYKTVLGIGDVSTGYVYRSVGLWRSTSAITSITVGTDATSIMAGSTFSLFGLKAA